MLTRDVTEQEIADFHRDGVVMLRDIYPIEWVDRLRVAMDEAFARDSVASNGAALVTGASTEGSRSDMVERARARLERDDGAVVALQDGKIPTGRSIVETDACAWHDGLRQHHSEGPLPLIVSALTDSSKVILYSDQLFLKEAGSSVMTPWHQDKPYWLMEGEKVAVCWVPVDEVTIDSGAMGYVIGSHRWGRLFKPSDFVTATGTYPTAGGIYYDDLDDVPPIDAEPETYEVRRFEAGPGDVIVHHWMTLHGSTGNISANRLRRAASIRYAGDDVTFLKRRSSPEPFRHTIELDDGDPLEAADRFAVVYKR
jgi:ectoine hydroxylase-related dioxygenase (phytanoyl-CoA dioxygenase family)